jgi:hypothetical protein
VRLDSGGSEAACCSRLLRPRLLTSALTQTWLAACRDKTSQGGSRHEPPSIALFTTGQQIGAAVGLAIPATVAAARTAHASGSLVAGYQLSFPIATALALLAGVLVAWQLSSRDCQQELARQQSGRDAPPTTPAEAQLRKC